MWTMFVTIHKRAELSGGILDVPMDGCPSGRTRSRYRAPEAGAELTRGNADLGPLERQKSVPIRQALGSDRMLLGLVSVCRRECAPPCSSLLANATGFRFSPITLKKS